MHQQEGLIKVMGIGDWGHFDKLSASLGTGDWGEITPNSKLQTPNS
ncbi:MAG: hypothetical protein HEQ19_14375 [Gloeotrichia echinulata CP02]